MDSTDSWMRRAFSLTRIAAFVSLLIIAVGCGDDGDGEPSSTADAGPDASSKRGAFGYPCYDDGTCDPGWTCRSGTCFGFNPDAGDGG